MNIVLFGGSFNPSHLGHQIVIAQSLELIPNVGELWLLPDYQHSFEKNNSFAPAQDRLAMARMLERNKVKTEKSLIDRKLSGNTIDHIALLQKKYPQPTFSFLMGSDNLKRFTEWPDWQQLLKLMTFYIYPRAGFPFKPLYNNMQPLEHPLQVITNISSTLVRERLEQHLPITHLVPEKVLTYIHTHHLYAS
ncbi:MAG: nicotinate (nicotinamide) nucleotide adenylyltransferase [Candidatus Chisholmbacteria bacterium]|nr:nicotinate (nicotinamide) nucleotide adenylyltransferase [Candidatus Chisholmbacteria bacterium]